MPNPSTASPRRDLLIIGSDPDSDVQVLESGVEHHHAKICRQSDGRWMISDLGTASGTLVNGKRITLAVLREKDVITIGRKSLVWPADFTRIRVADASNEVPQVPTPPQTPQIPGPQAPSPPMATTKQRLIIGSGEQADIQIDDPDVENEHAILERDSDKTWMICDLGTATGTFVNGNSITLARLGPDSKVTLGGLTLEWPEDFILDRPLTKAYRSADRGIIFSEVIICNPGESTPQLETGSLNFERGTLTAIIGPSGIGKSTLCRALLGEAEIVSGTVTVGGRRITSGQAPNPSEVSFVPQDTCLLEDLTVQQTLDFAVQVRNARTRTAEQCASEIERVLSSLNLADVMDRKVSKLSGGQKKRLSVAQELISRPTLLILDEPTSGLDEGLDEELMSILREISRSSALPTVLIVTHTISHLSIADNVCAVGVHPERSAREPRNAKAIVRFTGHPNSLLRSLGAQTSAECMNILRDNDGAAPRSPIAKVRRRTTKPGFRSLGNRGQMRPLLRRERTRHPFHRLLLGSLGVTLSLSLLILICGDGLGTAMPGDNGKMVHSITILVLLLCFWSLYLPVMKIVRDWPITRREQRWGISARLHLAARIIWDLPGVVAVPVATVVVIRYAVPFVKDSPELSWGSTVSTALVLVVTCLCCYMIGILIGAMSDTGVSAIQRVIFVISIMVIFCGIVIPLGDKAYLDTVSRIVPSRLAIAELTSILDAAQGIAPHSVSDPLQSASLQQQFIMFAAIVAVGALSLCLAGRMVDITMRRLDRKD